MNDILDKFKGHYLVSIETFVERRATKYVLGYDCDGYDNEAFMSDLRDYLDHPEGWRQLTDNYGDLRLLKVSEIKEEIERSKQVVNGENTNPYNKKWYANELAIYEAALQGTPVKWKYPK